MDRMDLDRGEENAQITTGFHYKEPTMGGLRRRGGEGVADLGGG